MEHYTDLAFRYIKMKKVRSRLTVLGVSVSVMLLYIILNLGWSYILNARADIRSIHDYEIVLFTEDGTQIEQINSDNKVKDISVSDYYKYDYDTPKVYENAMYINTTNPYRMDNILSELTEKYGVDGELNDDLAQLYLQGRDGEQMRVLILVFFLVSYIFAIFGVGIIRNTIQLTLFEQVKDFGNLRCIGSTKKQMQAVIFIQGAVLELAGIILGILLGTVGSMIGGVLAGWSNTGFHFLPVVFVVAAFIFDLYFAMKENAKMVTGMSPVSAIRGEYRIHIKKKRKKRASDDEEFNGNTSDSKKSKVHRKTIRKGAKGSIVGKLFGIEGEYAYKNIMRAPGRFFKVVTAMTFGVTAVIILSCGILAAIRYDRKWQDYYGYYPIFVTWYMGITDNWADAASRVPFTRLNNEITDLDSVTEAKRVFVDEMLVADEEDFFSHFSEEYYGKERGMDIREELIRDAAGDKDKEVQARAGLIYYNAVWVSGYDERDMARMKDHLVEGTLDVSDEGLIVVADDYMWTYDDRYSIDDQNSFLKHEHLLDYKIGDTVSLIDMNEFRRRYIDMVADVKKEYDDFLKQQEDEYDKASREDDWAKINELEKQSKPYEDAYYDMRHRAIVEIYDAMKAEGLFKTYKIEGIIDKNVISRANVDGNLPQFIVPETRFHEVTGREKDYFSGMMYHFDPFTLRQYEKVDWVGAQGDIEKDGEVTYAYDGYSMSDYKDWEYVKMGIRNIIIASALISMFLVSMVVLNYINNTASNIYLRRKEFAQLRVIGVSKKGVYKMVMLESIIAAIISCVLGVAFGSGISYAIIMFIFRYYKDIEFTFPWIPAILSVFFSVLILCGAVYFPLKRLPNDVAAELSTAGE